MISIIKNKNREPIIVRIFMPNYEAILSRDIQDFSILET